MFSSWHSDLAFHLLYLCPYKLYSKKEMFWFTATSALTSLNYEVLRKTSYSISTKIFLKTSW